MFQGLASCFAYTRFSYSDHLRRHSLDCRIVVHDNDVRNCQFGIHAVSIPRERRRLSLLLPYSYIYIPSESGMEGLDATFVNIDSYDLLRDGNGRVQEIIPVSQFPRLQTGKNRMFKRWTAPRSLFLLPHIMTVRFLGPPGGPHFGSPYSSSCEKLSRMQSENSPALTTSSVGLLLLQDGCWNPKGRRLSTHVSSIFSTIDVPCLITVADIY